MIAAVITTLGTYSHTYNRLNKAIEDNSLMMMGQHTWHCVNHQERDAESRRNTKPGGRPIRAESMSRGRGGERREWLQPHPLMPRRPRRTPTASRDASAFKDKDDTASKPRE
ncbi:hypothetical protein F5Y00DRAFT_124330 [Daldinia vernicosa]|uniref:uncharacterized protein n=1 Tax=Daldinia vernicosa TaxID=114800 RepID=UPI0020075061|nr:uncharacterized protein F5Y00DRAFT_124330 [Daldinia vernicosa]KAI0847042.1 hypothetical protein F5Y00DRAFT_124330 [Daldinia vernicosa]